MALLALDLYAWLGIYLLWPQMNLIYIFIHTLVTRCLCNKELNHAIDISSPSLNISIDELGLAVDWWAEGVCLPIIALVGICGEYNNIMSRSVYDVKI